jgi:hypothetical protein
MFCGKRICFHGAFHDKELAKRKEKEVHGFIREMNLRGNRRYVVMSGKPTRKYKREMHSDSFFHRLMR